MSPPRSWILVLLLAACTGKEEAPPALTITTEALDFGEVPIGAPQTQAFTLANEGGGLVELLSISLIEGSASVWSVERDDSVTELGGGASTEVTVTFSPSQQTAYEGRVQVRSDDVDASSLYVALAGQGGLSTTDADGDGYSPATGDCDDGNANVYPGADEGCDGRDTDCDGSVPADEADVDRDGWLVCEEDCDDGDPAVFPGAPEICDDKDSDCDGVSADRDDLDEDGFAICDGDCDDDNPRAWPGNPEICDGIDNDCSGDWDDIDNDGDSHSPCGAAGDCDDDDPAAYPVLVDAAATGTGDGTEENPFRTLDEALANLDLVCRTVQLEPGTYEVAVAWSDDNVTIGGGGRGADEVILTAPAGARQFDVIDGGELTLANLTLQGGSAAGDGGALRVTNATVTLDGIIAEGNTCTGDGGAVAAASGTVRVYDSTFRDNVAVDDGGAISVLSGVYEDSGSTFEGNSGVRGGALMLDSSVLSLADLVVTGNAADDEGGGMELIGGADVWIERVLLTGNTAGGAGGGVSIINLADSAGVLRNLTVNGNTAGTSGGGVAITGSIARFLLASSTVVANTSVGEGGGVYANATDADGLYLWANVLGWNDGASGLYAQSGSGASAAYNTGYSTTSGTDFDLGDADAGDNDVENPLFTGFTNDGDPSDDDLSLTAASPARDSGPTDGEGPATYPDWNDPDDSRNDRGATGGPGASP